MTADESESATPQDVEKGELTLECPVCEEKHPTGVLGFEIDDGLAAEMCPECGFRYSTPPVPSSGFDEIVSEFTYPRPNLDQDEVERRLPAVDLIRDDGIRVEVLALSSKAPAYFWMTPASRNDHHHPACREDRGLWAHTLMVATVVERLIPSYVERDLITYDQADYARAAAILHDQRKNGPYDDPSGSSVSDHDILMAEEIRRSTLPNLVADTVAAHMGPWYDGPNPSHPLHELVHNADMVASTASVEPAVPAPMPEELEDLPLQEVEL